MSADTKEDPTFFDRADSFIRLANDHCAKVSRGKVSASLLYGSARFQAWNAACWADDGDDMKAKRAETVAYFVEQYKKMLEERPQGRAAPSPPPTGVKETWGGPAFPCENLDDYIEHFAQYMQADGEG